MSEGEKNNSVMGRFYLTFLGIYITLVVSMLLVSAGYMVLCVLQGLSTL